MRSEEGCAWWSEGKRGKKGAKGNESFRKGGVRTHQPEKGASSDFNPHKGRGKDQKRRGKEGAHLQLGFQPLKTPVKKDKAIPGNQTIGVPTLLTILAVQLAQALVHGMIQDILYGWPQSL